MLGLVAPDAHGEERCLLVLPGADCDPEHGPGDATLGVADLGLVGEVAGEADGCLGHVVPLPVAWPGGLPCPWNRGTVDTRAAVGREAPAVATGSPCLPASRPST